MPQPKPHQIGIRVGLGPLEMWGELYSDFGLKSGGARLTGCAGPDLFGFYPGIFTGHLI